MYILYKTTNLINGKIYVGIHNGSNRHYLGSGKLLKLAIEKYGRKNFKRETLLTFDRKEEAYKKEADIVNSAFILREDTYNMILGGAGGWSHVDTSGDNNCMKRPEVVEKAVNTCRANQSYSTEARRNAQRRASEAAAIKRKGIKDSADAIAKRRKSLNEFYKDPENRKKISDGRFTNLAEYVIIDPSGRESKIKGIHRWCKEMGFPLSTATTKANKGKINNGKLKGYEIWKIL